MTKGFVTIATGNEKYFKLAKNLLDSYHMFTTDKMPFAIITDRRNKYTKEFDEVVILENAKCSWMDKLSVLTHCPFDENIFIDADCLAYGDLNEYWDAFSNADDFSCFGTIFNPEVEEGGWFKKHETGKYANQIDYTVHLHGVMYFVRSGKKCQEMYNICQEIIREYSNITFSGFNDKLADEPILALAMAICKFKPVERKKYYYVFVPFADEYTVDIKRGKVTFKNPKDGEVDNCLLVHWGNTNTEKAIYKLEIDKLCFNMNGYSYRLTDKWLKQRLKKYNIIDRINEIKDKMFYYIKRIFSI